MQTAQQNVLLAPEFFEALPESVLWFKPVWSAEGSLAPGQIVDFEAQYCNDAATRFLNAPKEAILGARIRQNNIVDRAYQELMFRQCVEVWETGRQHEESFYNAHLGRYFSVLRSKMLDGVVSIARDRTESYKLDQQQQQQAALLSRILDTSINAVFACGAIRDEQGQIVDLRFLKINQAFTQLTGKSEEDIIGQTYLTCFPAGKENGLFDLNCHVIETGEPVRKEVHYKSPELTAWYEVSLAKLDTDGLVVTFADITENKKDKLQLEQNAVRLQTIINTSPSGIFTGKPVYDASGAITDFRFTLANRTLTDYIGSTPELLAGQLGSQGFPAYKTNGLFERFRKTWESGEAQRFDFHYSEDQIDAWADMMVTRLGDEVLVTFTDFTSLRKLQQAAEKAATRLNTVINTSQVGIHTLSPVRDGAGAIIDFRFGIVNPPVAAYIGQAAETLAGELASKWFPAYMTNGLFDIYKESFESNSSRRFDFHYGDGYDVYFDILATRIDDEVLVTFTDHTTIKQLQLQLEASIEELKKSNANLEEFAYAASHDLQEPLRKIHFFSERLKGHLDARLNEEELKMFARMEAATQRMRTLIDDLLAYARTSRHAESFEDVSLDELVDEVMKDMEAAIVEKDAQITVADLPQVKGCKAQLRQLFQNLLSNSLKYSNQGTPPQITITSEAVKGYRHVLPLPAEASNGDYYKIEVKDNGIGFQQEDAERIFHVFQRLHGRSEYSGTGVGLAIVRKVVDNHHGFIYAHGEMDKGATFTVLLPA